MTDTLPFSLCCFECDWGDGIDSQEEAVLLGWHDIQQQDGGSYNYLGWCPECWKLEQGKT